MNKACHIYVQQVMKFRKALNLTSINNPEVFEMQFIRPSLSLAEWIPEQGRLLDIGSGMGIPGIPLLIAKPGLHGVLVERRKKRAEFLRHIVRLLGLDAEVHDVDINNLDSLRVDICVARAVADQSRLLEMCGPHANKGAVAVLPVPRDSESALVKGWTLRSNHYVDLDHQLNRHGIDSGNQSIQCYDYCGV